MLWPKHGVCRTRQHNELVRDKWFCLLPRDTEDGYVAWLCWIERERKWCLDNPITREGHWWTTHGPKYYLTKRQKLKLGITW